MLELMNQIQAIVEDAGSIDYADMLEGLPVERRRSALFLMKRMEKAGILHRELAMRDGQAVTVLHAGPREGGDA